MTLERFKELLDAFGADLGRWPDAEQAAARALIARMPEAQAALAEARRLDALLDLYDPPADRAAEARLRAALDAVPARAAVRPARRLWPQAAALAATLLLGVATGIVASNLMLDPANGEGDAVRLVLEAGPLEGLGL
jgi:ferric-dicitrate binding protein FerR (iron transport regulator)